MNDDPCKISDPGRYQFGLRHALVLMFLVAAVLGVARWSVQVAMLVTVDLMLVGAFAVQLRAGRRYRERVARLPPATYHGTVGCLFVLLMATAVLMVYCIAATIETAQHVR